MIGKQRRAHRIIWLFIAVLLPILLFFSIRKSKLSIDKVSTDQNQFSIQVKGSQVNVALNAPLKSSSSVVYELNQEGIAGKILGQLEGVGKYHFQISEKAVGVLIFDGIKGEELLKIKF